MSKGHWAIIASIGGTRNYEEYRLLWDTEHAFDRLERGEIAQPVYLHVDSCGTEGCGECYPIPTIYVTWESYT